MNPTRLTLAAVLILVANTTPAATWHVADGARLRFQARQMGVPMKGGFTQVHGNLQFDWPKPQGISGAIVVDIDSLQLDAGDFVDTLMGTQWFAAKQHPRARFQADTIKAAAGGGFALGGRLTIKGISHPLNLAISLQPKSADELAAKADFQLQRLDYAIGSGDWSDTSVVADPVEVHAALTLLRDAQSPTPQRNDTP